MSQLESLLKSKNLRRTKARDEVYEFLQNETRALTAAEMHESLSQTSNLDVTSIYRNLDLFEELGVVHRLHGGRYVACKHDDSCEHNQSPHVVSYCGGCWETFETDQLSKKQRASLSSLNRGEDHLFSVKEVVLQGLCRSCS